MQKVVWDFCVCNESRMELYESSFDWREIAKDAGFSKTTDFHMSSLFGVTLTLQILWNIIWPSNIERLFKPKHLLWTLCFLKCYLLQAEIESFLDVDHKTFFKWVWYCLELNLDINTIYYITWDNRFEGWDSLTPSFILDTTLCSDADAL